jgi:GTP cyclohydrolase N terminal
MRFSAAQRLAELRVRGVTWTPPRYVMNPNLLSTANGSPIRTMTERPQLVWGAPTAAERGPVIATLRNPAHRNAVGSHAGGYSVYRALAIAARTLAHDHVADLTSISRAATTCGRPLR